MTRALVVAELPQWRPVTRLTLPGCRRVDPTHELERIAQRSLLGGSTRWSADLHAAGARDGPILRHAGCTAIPEMRDATRHFVAPFARGPTRRVSDVPVIPTKHLEELQAPQSADGVAIGSFVVVGSRTFGGNPISAVAYVGVLEIECERSRRGRVHDPEKQQSQYHMHLRRNLLDHLHFLRTRNCCAQGAVEET
jgi:hypothetical protein